MNNEQYLELKRHENCKSCDFDFVAPDDTPCIDCKFNEVRYAINTAMGNYTSRGKHNYSPKAAPVKSEPIRVGVICPHCGGGIAVFIEED